MSESIRSTCYAILIAAGTAAAIAWANKSPDALVWAVRLGCPIVGLIALGVALGWRRRDLVPDYLIQRDKSYFSRDGLCFSVDAVTENGICYVEVPFQSQHDQPSSCRIGVRPLRGLLGRPKIQSIAFDIECAPAAYGVARAALPLEKRYQGKSLEFEVGASVQYPGGKGQRLRFREGVGIKMNSDFRDLSGTLLALMFGLLIKYTRCTRSRFALDLPAGVAESVEGRTSPQVTTLWRLGDPHLS